MNDQAAIPFVMEKNDITRANILYAEGLKFEGIAILDEGVHTRAAGLKAQQIAAF
jgi:hypothetical protein